MTGNPKTLKTEVAELKALVAELQIAQDIPDPILAEKGQFFGLVLAHAVGQMGSRAFSDNFLQKMENNAERLWQAYVAIVRGDSIMLANDRIAEEQEKVKVAEAALSRAKATILAQGETIRDLSTVEPEEDELPEAATPEEAEAAAALAEDLKAVEQSSV